MGIAQELWRTTPVRGPRPWAPAGREPSPLPQTPELQKVDALNEHSAGMGRELLGKFLQGPKLDLGDFSPPSGLG